MKAIIGLIWIVGFAVLGILIPNLMSKGVAIPVDLISIVAVVLVILSVVIGFIGKNNDSE